MFRFSVSVDVGVYVTVKDMGSAFGAANEYQSSSSPSIVAPNAAVEVPPVALAVAVSVTGTLCASSSLSS